MPNLGDSNDEEPHEDSKIPVESDDVQASLHQQDCVRHPPPPPPPSLPLDMVAFLQNTSSYDLQLVFGTAATVSSIPRHIPSEHPGGDARGGIMKSRAAKVTLTVSEVFALATSGTHSFQDTAVVLETFGNVSWSCLNNFTHSLSFSYVLILVWQLGFSPSDVLFITLCSMSDSTVKTFLPDEQIILLICMKVWKMACTSKWLAPTYAIWHTFISKFLGQNIAVTMPFKSFLLESPHPGQVQTRKDIYKHFST